MMRTTLKLMLVLLTSGPMLLVTGCSDNRSAQQKALDESLTRAEQLREKGPWDKPAPPPTAAAASGAATGDAVTSDATVPTTGTFVVKVESSTGDYKIEFHRAWAPIGAERFYHLVRDGFYDECRYFRVMPDFMVQFGINGDPAVQSKWDLPVKDDAVIEHNRQGYVTFATSGPNSRTTQIFINLVDNFFLDGQGFAPFGKVIEGMSSVDAINSRHRESPDQGRITSEGNAYLNKDFPELDYVKKMTLESESAPSIDAGTMQKSPEEAP
ncbi:MAG TPA: peptidylprolyl isomerase [Planctomycetaceae bacterium]|nr:peptidylprolyl isomerase [Planctomycetaceae bacterium]